MTNENVISWLLEEKEPSIRYRTLTELLGLDNNDIEVTSAKEKVSESKNAERIFARRNENGLFPHKPDYYGNLTTFNYLNALAELGLKGDDERISPIVDWILTPGTDKVEHFVQKEFPDAYILDENNLGSCRQIRFLSTLVRLGFLDDPRVIRLLEVFIEKNRFDGGYLCKWKKSNYKNNEPKSCYTATVPALFLYSVLPESYRTGDKYRNLLDYFISRNMIYSKIEPKKIICDTKLGFYSTGLSDILTIAYSMSKLGVGNIPEMEAVWDILRAKPNNDGKYLLEADETKKAILMDKIGKPNKWITFYILLSKKERAKCQK